MVWGVGKKPSVALRGDGDFTFPVVGESYRQEALSAICGGHCDEGHELECRAELRPEPRNPHDPNAVQVLILGRHVGYLPRENAVLYHRQMSRLGHPGRTATCDAMIRGGWRREGREGLSLGHFGVVLDVLVPFRIDN